MSALIGTAILVCCVAAIGAGTVGCSGSRSDGSPIVAREAADTRQTIELKCGTTTYRIMRRRVTADVHAACDRVGVSLDALQTYRASVARFTCQESDGPVVHSLLVPKDLRDAYEQDCRTYLRADAAFRAARGASSAARTAALHTQRAALASFEDAANALARRYAAEDGALLRQRQADQGSMNALVKDLRGSIETAD